MKFKTINLKTCFVLLFFFGLWQKNVAQAPSDSPCDAPILQVSEIPGVPNFTTFERCCQKNYHNFLDLLPDCFTTTPTQMYPNFDAWYEVGAMNIGQAYNFLYIETGHRATMLGLYELPTGADCSNPKNYINISCAVPNDISYYLKVSVSATFKPLKVNSRYFLRLRRMGLTTDQEMAGQIAVLKAYPNDEPCGATPLTIENTKDSNPVKGSTIAAADWNPLLRSVNTCGTNNDVWYKFVATACSIDISVVNKSNTSYEIQAGLLKPNNGSCNSFTELAPCGGWKGKFDNISLHADALILGQTYYIVVDGYSPPYEKGVGDFTIEVIKSPIQNCNSSATREQSADFSFSLNPNPAFDLLNIDFQDIDNQDFKVEISNVSGQILQKQNNNSTIDVSMLSDGLYFCKVIIEEQISIARFVISR